MLSNSGPFDAASLELPSPSQENYVQPNLGHGLRIWWAYYWPTSLISFFIVVVLTVLLRRAWENDVLSDQVVLWAGILPYVVISAVSMFGIWRILGKKFRSFSIALLPRTSASGGEPLPRSFERTLRVWWEFIWRAVVYSVILRIAGSIALSMTIGILAALGGPMRTIVPFVSQVLIDGAVGLFVMYSGILDEEFADFRVTLVPRAIALTAAPAVQPAAPSSLP